MSAKKRDLSKYSNIVQAIRIDHDAYATIREELEMAYDAIGTTPTPVCVLLTGETRTGKSCVVLEFAETYLPSQAVDQTARSIVRAVTPETATVKSLLESLLKGLGDPHWSRGTISSMTHRLHVMLEAVQCKLIVLDEFQHLCDKGQRIRMMTVADWLKNLLQTNQYGLLAVGLPESASVVHAHRQLSDRFDCVLQMPQFDWKVDASAAQFRGVLVQFQEQLKPFELPPMDSKEMGFRMFLATAGRIGLVAKLLDRAIRVAIRAGSTKIRIEDLARAYARSIWSAPRFPVPGGPFGAEIAKLSGSEVQALVVKIADQEAYAERDPKVSVFKGEGINQDGGNDFKNSGGGKSEPKKKEATKRSPKKADVARELALAL